MPAPGIRALEPRFVFDGAAAPAAAQAHSEAAAQSHAGQADAHADTSHVDASHVEPADRPPAAPAGMETASANGRHEIVVIDRGVADLQTLLAGVPASAEVILIDPGRDGFDQLADALKDRSGIDAIHILSHGSAGDLHLGTGELTASSIQGRYAADLAVIGKALTATGDLLIYGCDFAAGEAGARAAALLAQATGADVAASNDATGDAALGGDWTLEVHDGAIETGTVIDRAAQRDWHHLLGAAVDNGRGALLAVSDRTIYSVDIATGKATALTTAPSSVGGIALSTTLNSLAVDQANGLIYYVDGATTAGNKALFAYDMVNDRHILIDADLTNNGTGASIVTGSTGVGGAGAAFSRGTLYLAVENVSGSDDQIYKLTFSNGGRTVATAGTFGSAITRDNDWGDIVVDTINNQLISLTSTSFTRYNLGTGAEISYAAGTRTDYQAGFDQGGYIYSVGSSVTRIDPTNGSAISGVAITTDGTNPLGAVNDAAAWTPPTSVIAGRVFGDTNANGAYASPEPGIAGVTVQLVDDVNGNGTADAGERVLATDTSAADGSYSFTGLLPGQFIVRVTDTAGKLAGTTATTATSGSLTDSRVGASLFGPNFGYRGAPVIDLDASGSGTGFSASYTENGAGTALADTDSSITDVDSPTLASLKAVITNGMAGDVLAAAGTLPSGITASWNAATYTLTLSGSATRASYETALEQIRFTSTSDNPSTTARTVTVSVNDGESDSNAATATIAVTAVNDAPVNAVPGAQTLTEDGSLTFSAANGNAIGVSDVDAGGGSLTTTLSVPRGTISLGSTAGVTVAGNGTGTVSLTGTAAAITAALDGTLYRPIANDDGSLALTVTTNDNGNSGSGGAQSDTDTITLTMTPVNDAPVLDLDASGAGTGFSASYIENGTGTAIVDTDVSVTDVDNATMTSAKAVIGNGKAGDLLSVAGSLPGGITASWNAATYTLSLAGSASKADYQTALTQIRFSSTSENPSTAQRSIAVTVNDGVSNSNAATATVSVTAVNDAPVNTLPAAQTTAEDTALSFSTARGNAITVSDADAGNGNLTTRLSVANGVLKLGSTSGVTVSGNNGATVTLTGTVSAINAALNGTVYTPGANYNGTDTLTVTTNDNGNTGTGGAKTDTDTVSLTVTPVNDAPVLDLDTATSGRNYTGTYAQGDPSVPITGASVSVSDVDDTTIASAKAVIGNGSAGDELTISGSLPPGITAAWDAATYTLTLTGSASKADYQTALGLVRFGSSATQPAGGTRTISVTVDDGDLSSNVATASLGVTGLNSAPVNDLPQAQSVDEDTDLVFSAGNGNAVTISDTDAGSGSMTVTLTVAHGSLTAVPTTGVTTSGDGSGTLSLAGTVSDINAALDGLRYRPEPDYNGADALTVVTSDNGNTGSGGPQQDSDTLQLTVNPVNDAPVNLLPPAQSVDEDADLVFSTGNGNAIAVSDIDAGGGSLTTTLGVLHGTLTIGGTTGVTVSGNGTGTLTLIGTVADINAALDGVVYRGTAYYNGADTLTVTTDDGGNTGTGGAKSDSDTLALTVNPVENPPTNAVPAGIQAATEDTALVFSAGHGNGISVADPDGGSLTVTLSTDHGLLSLPRLDGLTFLNGDGAGDAAMTFSGTIADINAALEGLRFVPDADYNGPARISLVTQDPARAAQGFTNGGFENPAVAAGDFDILPESSVPGWKTDATDHEIEIWNSGHNGVTAYEGDQFAEINANQVAALYQDFKATAGSTVTLDFAHRGRLGTDTMAVKVIDLGADGIAGTADDRTLFDKTYADGNTAWGVYRETLSETASGDTLRFEFRSVSAEGGSQSFGNFVDGIRIEQSFRTASAIDLAVAPVADIVPDDVATDEDTAIGFNALTGTNGASADTFDSPAAYVSSVTQGAHGRVDFAADGAMTYTPEANFNGTDSFTYTVTSGGTTETATVTVTVRPVNDVPVLDLSAAAPGTGYATGYTERAPGVAIVDTDVSVSDADDADLASARAVITNGRTGDTLSVEGTLPPGITAHFDQAAYTLTLTGAASQADYRAALQQIRFSSAEHDPSRVTRSIDVSVNDGTVDSNLATTKIVFTAINDAPVNGMPADQALDEDTSLVFSSDNGNRITVSDADARSGDVTTTLGVLHGTLTLGSTRGVTVANDGSGSVTLTGTVAAINAALDGTTYRPDADYNGTDTLTVLTNDNGHTGTGGARSDTDAIRLTVAPVNDAPRAGTLPAIGSLDGDAVAGADLGRYFSDVDGDAIRFTVTGLPAGLAVDPATGIVSGTIDRSASRSGSGGDYAVTITADDGHGGLTSRDFTWRVIDPAPVARDDGAIGDAATPLTGSVLADNGNGPDSDPDGDPLTVSAVNGQAGDVGQPVAGSAGGRFTVLADGSYRFDPGSDFVGLAAGETRTTRITYTISDGDGGTAEASFAVTVTGSNDVPAALAARDQAAADGQTVSLPLGSLFSDPDGDALGFSATGLPPGLSIDPATGAVTGTIDHAASGPTGLADYQVTITATDPHGASAQASFTLRVTNPAPHAADDRAAAVEDVPLTIDVLANDSDPDGDTLAIVAAGDAAPSAGHGRAAVVDGRLVYTPDANFNGTDTITYTIADGNGGTSTASVTITVAPQNDAPYADPLPDQSGRHGSSVSYDVSGRFHDPDTDPSVVQTPTGDRLSFGATGLPPGLVIDPATGLITGTLPSGIPDAARYAVTVTATDASGASGSRSFTWTVTNDAPVALPDTATTREDTPVLVAVTANDADPDGDAIRLVDEPGATSAAHGSVSADPVTGLITYTPDPDFNGRDTIVYTIEDTQGVRATGTLTVTVTPVNDRPVAPGTLPGRNGADGDSVRVPLGNLFADPDGDPLAYSAAGLPPGLTIDPATGEIAGTIDHAASGPTGRTTYVVTLTATDPDGLAVSRSFAWTVTNPAPSAADDAIATPEDTPVDIDVTGNDTDPDGDALSVVPGSMAAAHGSVTLNPDGSLRYTPDRDFNGTDHIVYTITDGNGGFATASATITVTPVNDAPTVDPSWPALADRAANDAETVSIPAGGAFGDVDAGDRLSFSATGLPPGLAVDPATGLISGKIASDASSRAPGGVYTIALTATDLAGATATTHLTITVSNPAPVAGDDAATLAEDTVLTGSVLDNDGDPDGDAIHVDPVPVAGPAHGRLDLRPDGSFTYTPDADFHGADAFTYALVDSDGGRSTATVHLTVTSVNDAPEAAVDPVTTREDTPVDGRIVASDRDGDPLTYTVETPPGAGSLTLRPDGGFTYVPGPDRNGADSFVVRVSDGQGGSVLVSVPITIDPVNDAPDAHADPIALPANTTARGSVVAIDRDGDPLSFHLAGPPANGRVVLAADGTYAYTPYAAYSGSDRFTVEVSDGQGGLTRVTVEVTVTPNPVQVPPGALVSVLAPPSPFVDPPAAAPVLQPVSSIVAQGFVLPALAEIDALGSVSDVILADGAVVAAVNGVASLHGTAMIPDHPVVLDEADRIAGLSWERFEHGPADDAPWFSPRPYLGRSLGFSLATGEPGTGSDDLMVEAIRRPDTLSINLRNAAPDVAAVAEVRLLGIGGAPPPDWIEGDGRGGFWGRPPAGTGLLAVELEVVLSDGSVVRRPLTVDAETGEVRALPSARRPVEPAPLRSREPDAAPRGEALPFSAQLAALETGAARTLTLIEHALARHH